MQAYQFLKECGTFWVTTIDKGRPASRPFGAVMERGGELYISTSATKAVYKQLKTNPAVQLTAIKPGTREWIRIDGEAVETSDLDAKAQMLKDCPPPAPLLFVARRRGIRAFSYRKKRRPCVYGGREISARLKKFFVFLLSALPCPRHMKNFFVRPFFSFSKKAAFWLTAIFLSPKFQTDFRTY